MSPYRRPPLATSHYLGDKRGAVRASPHLAPQIRTAEDYTPMAASALHECSLCEWITEGTRGFVSINITIYAVPGHFISGT